MTDLDQCIAGVLGLKRFKDTEVWCTARQKQCFDAPLSEDWNALMAAVKVLEENKLFLEFQRRSYSWCVFLQGNLLVDEEFPEPLALAKCIQAVVESEK